MLLMAEKGVRAGICHSINRYEKANNKYLKDYDKNKESSYLQYQDVNRLYGCTMSQKSPINNFAWIKDTSQFNRHMHKIGPGGPKQYIFGNHSCSKNAITLTFHGFLHFIARKPMKSSFFLKWTELIRNCQFVPIQFGSPGTHNRNKIHNFL